MKNTIVTFREAKGQEKLVMLTAYDYSTARVMDMAGVDALLDQLLELERAQDGDHLLPQIPALRSAEEPDAEHPVQSAPG